MAQFFLGTMIGYMVALPFIGGVFWTMRMYQLAWLFWIIDLFVVLVFWLIQEMERAEVYG